MGAVDMFNYMSKLQSLVTDLRKDFGDMNIPLLQQRLEHGITVEKTLIQLYEVLKTMFQKRIG